ncbi:hypothetical protein PV10_02631 [Exophiala mesophila]|uniref:Uncharacterized protein n=1 Tax=Exophiala mesophila TaxID=212818 RepID=A0A0D1WZF2_EXOME|nr:uncharacterized protein PV10_02631 [Exophiala mesophila]KIV94910.1 hypothetical protein PV10_02631 [Exophiala mesophila]
MSQQHRQYDANSKLLSRFYAPLTLLKVLDPCRGAQQPDLILDTSFNEQATLWRDFLDQLAYLCDFEKGGDTVTAIAVQRNAEYPIFWLATNCPRPRTRTKARKHLSRVLGLLDEIHTTQKPVSDVENDILSRCLASSSQRIKVYSSLLMKAIREARRMLKQRTDSEAVILSNEIKRLASLVSKPDQLCSHAYNLRKHTQLMEILNRHHHAHSNRGVWSDIRHHIGRLGSWTKAVRIVIRGAMTFPQRFESAQVRVIVTSDKADIPNKCNLTSLDDIVRRTLPVTQHSLVEELCEALATTNDVTNIQEEFWDIYAKIKPRPHAELLVLEHFHQKRLEFTANERYIGCSKPSCYCCHIYMQCHPGRFSPRPTHGNLWIQWAPPLVLPPASRNPNAPRPQNHHTFKMLQAMLIPIRLDLQEQIMSRRPKRKKEPDSTTGMSSVAIMHHGIGVPDTGTLADSTTVVLNTTTLESYHIHDDDKDPFESIGNASSTPSSIDCQADRNSPQFSARSDGEPLDYDTSLDADIDLSVPDHSGEKTSISTHSSCNITATTGNSGQTTLADNEDSDDEGGVLIFQGRKR